MAAWVLVKEALARAFSFTNFVGRSMRKANFWKGGRAAECGGLENRFAHNMGNEGSNPSPSASAMMAPETGAFFVPQSLTNDA